MKLYNIIILSIIIFYSICVDKFPLDDDVITLTDSTYEKAIEQYKYLMIYFYAPWCGQCNSFTPEYHKAAKVLKEEDNIHLAKIDASVDKRAAQKYKVNGYPTILFFTKGDPVEFEGGRVEKEIVNWVRKKIGKPIQFFETKEEIEKFKTDNEICFIYYGDDEFDIRTFEKASKFIEEFPFGVVKNEKLIKKNRKGTIVLHKHFDEKENVLKNINIQSISEFVHQYALPKVMIFNDKTVQYIFQKKNPALILYADKKSLKWNKYGNILVEVSEKINRKLAVVITEIKEGIASRLADYVGIKEKDLPLVSIIDTRKEFRKYNMEGKINVQNILNFIEKWEKNDLKRQLKSENEPKINNGNVFVVVGKTFEKEVINNDKDVILLFYAPWCTHCKELSPKYEQVGKRLKNNPKLLVAKIDGSQNEVESIDVPAFPTIMFFPGNQKSRKPIEYKGKRNTDDIIEFIKKYSYNKIIDEYKEEEEDEDDDNKDNKNEKEIRDEKNNNKNNDKISDL